MKSIYEEALNNTQILLDLVKLKKRRLTKYDMLNQIEKALEQAQKQEQLLKLYQKYNHDYDDLTLDEEIDIFTQIKELEK